MHKEQFLHIADGLLADGYRPYIDPLDMEVASDPEYPCSKCGSPDMFGVGYKHRETGIYRVFVRCGTCGYTEEF